MQHFRVGDLRIAKLADCELWRIERLARPRLLWRLLGFNTVEWRVVYHYGLLGFSLEPIPAEFTSFAIAQRALISFERGDNERHSRHHGLWTPVA